MFEIKTEMTPSVFPQKKHFMTYPVTFFNVHLHFIFEILSYTIGFRYYLILRKKTTDLISESDRMTIFIGAAAGAFVGSHALGILEKPLPNNLSALQFMLFFMANKTVLGGFLGGLIGVEWTKKMINVRTSSGDLMVFPLLLGLIIGRIGCHLEGLEDGTFGNATTLPWGIDFGDGISRHPTNLYEIIFLITLWLSIIYLEKNGKFRHLTSDVELLQKSEIENQKSNIKHPLSNGSRFKIFLSGYLIFRFFIEFLKPVYFLPMGLSSIQIAALLGLFYYVILFFKLKF